MEGLPETEWVLSALVDVRRGDVVERRTPQGGSGIADEEDVLFAAIEMLRCGERPSQVLLLGDEHVHWYRRSATEPHLAAIVIARRSRNLGLVLGALRARLEEVAP